MRSTPPDELAASVRVRVQPKASANRITIDERGIRVAVTAPPADDAANKAVCACLANRLGVAKSRVVIRTGHQAREKVVRIAGLAQGDVLERLALSNRKRSAT